MKKIIVLFTLVLLFSVGCITRNNPLDPYGHSDVSAPQRISGLEGNAHSGTAVELAWTPSSIVDGYYLYRSMSMNGKYERVDKDQLNSAEADKFIDHNNAFIARQYYWYKISGYVLVGDRKLEGYRSEPIYVYIPQN